MSVTILDREVFSEAEAARLLRVPQSTLHYWLEGGVRRGRQYRPVLRVEPRGTRTLTWAEFVEATLLRQYRRDHEVPMGEIRDFIDLLRERLGVPYPLAHKTWVPQLSLRGMAEKPLVCSQNVGSGWVGACI